MAGFFSAGAGAHEAVSKLEPMLAGEQQPDLSSRFAVTLDGGGQRLLCVVRENGEAKVDFKAYARHTSATWEDLLDGKVTEAREVRVFIQSAGCLGISWLILCPFIAWDIAQAQVGRISAKPGTPPGLLEHRGSGAGLDPELALDIRHMVVHRSRADAENDGNFGIPFALTEPVEDFALPRAQSRQFPQRVAIAEFGDGCAVLAAAHRVELSQTIQYPVVSLDWSEFMVKKPPTSPASEHQHPLGGGDLINRCYVLDA
jgi:hypothetical protein